MSVQNLVATILPDRRAIPSRVRRAARIAAAFLGLTFIYVILFGQIPRGGDFAGTYLAGIDMVHGNWRLNDWWLPPDPFVTTDVVLYGLAHLVIGYHVSVLLYVPAALWAGLVLMACKTASKGLGERGRIWALACVLTLLGVPIFEHNSVMDQITFAPMHVASLILVLAMFLQSDNLLSGRAEKPAALLAWLGLAAFLAVAGDPMVVVIGVAPILGAAALCRTSSISRRAAVGATVAGAVVAAKIALVINKATGGLNIVQSDALSLSFASWPEVLTNIGSVFKNLPSVFGAAFFDSKLIPALPELFRLPLLLAAGLSAGSVAVAIWPRVRAWLEGPGSPAPASGPSPLDVMLVVGVGLDLVAVALCRAIIDDYSTARYLYPVLVYGAVLAGRWAPDHRWLKAVTPVAAALSMLSAAQHYWSGPRHTVWADGRTQTVADWLREHKLHYGYGPYAMASLATVLDHGSVAVRPVVLAVHPNQLDMFLWLSKKSWYPASLAGRKPDFVVVDPAPGAPFTGDAVVGTFGSPKSIVPVAGYMIYNY